CRVDAAAGGRATGKYQRHAVSDGTDPDGVSSCGWRCSRYVGGLNRAWIGGPGGVGEVLSAWDVHGKCFRLRDELCADPWTGDDADVDCYRHLGDGWRCGADGNDLVCYTGRPRARNGGAGQRQRFADDEHFAWRHRRRDREL